MFRGHIDAVTHSRVEGWAANEDCPDDFTRIRISVNGLEIAEVCCDQFRPDLKNSGRLGHGRHGFSFAYPEPLPKDGTNRISVRFAENQVPVPGGDVALARDGTIIIEHPAGAGGILRLPAPSDPRTLFRTLATYDRQAGLKPLIDRLDFPDRRGAEETSYSVFGKLEIPTDASAPSAGYSAKVHLYELLTSAEFQRQFVALFLNAFPEKRRLFFVHIPKCAGTHLSQHLRTVLPVLDLALTSPEWTDTPAFLARIAALAQHIDLFDSILVAGHISLGEHLRKGLVRPSDSIFTIVRNPIEVALSQVNYIITRIDDDVRAGKPGTDTRQWSAALDIPLDDWDRTDKVALAHRLLRNPDVVQENSMCRWLGGTDAGSALRALRAVPIEITDVGHYHAWLAEKWKLSTDTRVNVSRPYLSEAGLPDEDRRHLETVCAEDMKLFSLISWTIEAFGQASIQGAALPA